MAAEAGRNNFGSFALTKTYMIPFDPSWRYEPPEPGQPLPSLEHPLGYQSNFISGLDTGIVVTDPTKSFWAFKDMTAHKWGPTAAGTGAVITYQFDAASNFSATEKAAFQTAFSVWEALANVRFVEDPSGAVTLLRGNDGRAWEEDNATKGAVLTLGTTTSGMISIDTSVLGFDLSGSLDVLGGYGMSTLIHEVGHLLGLGHGGFYDENVDATTDQNGPFDARMWTIMSYISPLQGNAKYAGLYSIDDEAGWGYSIGRTDWGETIEGYQRVVPQTPMLADISGIRGLYGLPESTPLDGGKVYGFNSNISGPLSNFYDFEKNTRPVVTVYSKGYNNTLDVSGFDEPSFVSIDGGTFSSVGGLKNNISIGGRIETVKTGVGDDTLVGSTRKLFTSTLIGGDGNDTYIIDGPRSNVIEIAGEGTADWVKTRGKFDLIEGVHVEFLSTTDDKGTDPINLYGNEFSQTIIGNAGRNYISDGGRAAPDILIGLGGDDTYRVYNSGTIIVEGADQGANDTVFAAVSYKLQAGVHVERLIPLKASEYAKLKLHGNELAQTIIGNAGDNSLRGYGGDDIIRGGRGDDNIAGYQGNDILAGNAGADRYYFNTKLNAATNVDTISGFSSIDAIYLSKSIFTKAGDVGTLTKAAFAANTTGLAGDSSDRIIFETDTGKLFYDADGKGGADGILFAIIIGNAGPINNADFVIY